MGGVLWGAGTPDRIRNKNLISPNAGSRGATPLRIAISTLVVGGAYLPEVSWSGPYSCLRQAVCGNLGKRLRSLGKAADHCNHNPKNTKHCHPTRPWGRCWLVPHSRRASTASLGGARLQAVDGGPVHLLVARRIFMAIVRNSSSPPKSVKHHHVGCADAVLALRHQKPILRRLSAHVSRICSMCCCIFRQQPP